MKDMIGAWNMLNKRYFERLIPFADTIFAALRTYSIRPKQALSNYIWCSEIIYESCMEMMNTKVNHIALRDMLERGIREDYRFKHVCAMMMITTPKPNYEDFKERIQTIEIDKQIEDTMLITMEKSMERKYQYRNRTKDNGKNSRRKGHYKKDCTTTRDNNSDAESTRSYASTRSSASNIKKKKYSNKKINKVSAKIHDKYVKKEKKINSIKMEDPKDSQSLKREKN
jgi:hypothetical protein